MSYASKDFHATVTKWEAIFNEFHKDAKDGLLRIFDVTKKLTAVIESKFPDFEEKHIIQKFALSRTCFRKGLLKIWTEHSLQFHKTK